MAGEIKVAKRAKLIVSIGVGQCGITTETWIMSGWNAGNEQILKLIAYFIVRSEGGASLVERERKWRKKRFSAITSRVRGWTRRIFPDFSGSIEDCGSAWNGKTFWPIPLSESKKIRRYWIDIPQNDHFMDFTHIIAQFHFTLISNIKFQ